MKCANCGAEIPDVSRFCLSCGKELPPPKRTTAPPSANPDPNGYSMLLFGLAFMMFFFALAPMFLGLWIGAGLMMVVGLVLVLIGYMMLRANRIEIEEERKEAMIKVKCRYCGMLNDKDEERCASCGATL
jgi:hypothetical protein